MTVFWQISDRFLTYFRQFFATDRILTVFLSVSDSFLTYFVWHIFGIKRTPDCFMVGCMQLSEMCLTDLWSIYFWNVSYNVSAFVCYFVIKVSFDTFMIYFRGGCFMEMFHDATMNLSEICHLLHFRQFSDSFMKFTLIVFWWNCNFWQFSHKFQLSSDIFHTEYCIWQISDRYQTDFWQISDSFFCNWQISDRFKTDFRQISDFGGTNIVSEYHIICGRT